MSKVYTFGEHIGDHNMTSSDIKTQINAVCDRLDEIRCELAMARLADDWEEALRLTEEQRELRQQWDDLVEQW